MTDDFVYLNVPGLLERYENPSETWREKVLALAQTQVSFFVENGLLINGSSASDHPIESTVLRFSDFTQEGQEFIMSQAVERWLSSCDRNGTVDAYRDRRGLESRLSKFRTSIGKVLH